MQPFLHQPFLHTVLLQTVTCVGLLLFCCQQVVAGTGDVDYLKDIKPLLKSRCYACHGGLKQESSLRLDTASLALQGGDSGAVIVPGDPESSILLQKVTETDESSRMPPEGDPLSPGEVGLIRAWILRGATGPADESPEADPLQHWAFQVPVRPEVPAVQNPQWTRNPIDAFLLARVEKQELAISPAASDAELVRRLYLNLIGLPPTPAQLDAYLTNPSQDNWTRIVNELLDNPQHGERWGRHWMDVWRYSDWYGRRSVPDALNSYGQIWRWRDWIVRSVNEDKGYDQMILEMLAGDEIAPADQANSVATGFIVRNYYRWNYNTWMKDLVEHTGKAFLGLTLNCCHCHDHKYDPLTNREYFQFRAFFEPIDIRQERVSGEPDPGPYPEYKLGASLKPLQTGMVRIADAKLDAETFIYRKGESRDIIKGLPAVAPAPPRILGGGPFTFTRIDLPPQAWYPGLRDYVRQDERSPLVAEVTTSAGIVKKSAELAAQATSEYDKEYARLDQIVARDRMALAESRVAALDAVILADDIQYLDRQGDGQAAARAASRAQRLAKLNQARYDHSQAVRAVYAAKQKGATDAKTQKALATAVTSESAAAKKVKELTAALETESATYSPLGPQYVRQSSGRRIALARRIVSRQNPLTARVAVNHIWKAHFGVPLVGTPENFGRNGDSPTHPQLLDWLALELMEHDWKIKHIHRLILDSQAYRMSSNPALTPASNGKRDPENTYYWRFHAARMEAEVVRDSILYVAGQLDLTMGGKHIPDTEGLKTFRRSLYIEHHGEGRIQWLDLFDAPNPTDCYLRTTSVRPQQALALANSQIARRQGILLARLLHEQSSDNASFVVAAFRQVLSRNPTSAENSVSLEFLGAQVERFQDRLPQQDANVDKTSELVPSSDPLLRARENFVHALFSHSDFVTVR